MSANTKDNWDDSSDDEGDTPPDPRYKAKGDTLHDPRYKAKGDTPPDPLYKAKGDTLHDPLCKAKEEYHEVQFTEDSNGEEHPADDESGVEGGDPLYEEEYEQGGEGGAPLYEWGVQGGDPLSDDDYDDLDEYDKKLGRYVSCR